MKKKGKSKIESLPEGQQPEISEPVENEFPQIPDDIRTFLNESGIAEKGYTVYVYRCAARVGAGQKVRSFVNQYDNFLPTFREIGEEYGAGSYEIYIRWYDVEGKSASRKVIMNLDASFDQVKAEHDRKRKAESDSNQANQGRGGDPGGGAAAAMMQGVLMIKALSEAVAPILRPLIAGKVNSQEQQPDNFASTMATLQQMGSNMLMDNFKQGLNMQRELMANMPAMDGGREDTALEKMLSALDKLIPLFTSLSDKQIRPIAQTAADQSEDIQALLSDPARLQVTYSKLIEKYGQEKANRIMKAFGVREIHPLKQPAEFDPGGNGKAAPGRESDPVDIGKGTGAKRALKAAAVALK